MLNALAHVVVTEGLVDKAFVAERCDPANFETWARFIAEDRHSPEAVAEATGVPAAGARAGRPPFRDGRERARSITASASPNTAQGSTAVMAIANLAMATGNIGREGVGVNPLRGQNNVQGSCDMGSFPHEFSGYRHVSDDATREIFERLWGVRSQRAGPAHPQHDGRGGRRRVQGALRPRRGHRPVRSRHPAHHGRPQAMECVIVQDLFLNETARYAHVFLPGASFLEKDGTFTNAERRISRVRKAMAPLAGKADWETDHRVRRGARRPHAL